MSTKKKKIKTSKKVKSTAKKKKIKNTKKKVENKVEEELRPVLTKTAIKWEDAYPCLEQTFRVGKETVSVLKYHDPTDTEFDSFLYEVIRNNSMPPFIKSNFKKLRKHVEKEISHRDKLYSKLSKEQVIAFQSYFKDEMYFERDDKNEYFQHELEKVYFDYLKAYLETGLYESRVRSHNRRRRKTLAEHGIDG